MKLFAVTCLLAGVGIVGATPLRVIMVTSHHEISTTPRFGLPVAHINTNVAQIVRPDVAKVEEAGSHGSSVIRRPCKFRQKAVSISNAFRQALGLPLIEGSPEGGSTVHGGVIRLLPFVGTPPAVVSANVGTMGTGERVHVVEHHHGGHRFHHKLADSSFLRRIHYALMALGPWEGRAVAFVLGCGIGVLLRMLWVLAVISYRTIRGPREDTNEYNHIVCEYVDAEEIFVAPPNYTYTDEKVAPAEQGAPQAQAN